MIMYMLLTSEERVIATFSTRKFAEAARDILIAEEKHFYGTDPDYDEKDFYGTHPDYECFIIRKVHTEHIDSFVGVNSVLWSFKDGYLYKNGHRFVKISTEKEE